MDAFYKKYALQSACGEDKLRPDFSYVFFSGDYAYATDAYICVKANIQTISTLGPEIELLNGKALHGKLFKNLISSHDGFEVKQDEDGQVYFSVFDETGKNIVNYYLRDDIKAPNFDAIFTTPLNAKPVSAIGIKQKFMQRLCKAMGITDTLRLDMTGNDRAIFITDNMAKDDIHGIIMPVIVDEPEIDFGDNEE